MIHANTSVWVDHFRKRDTQLYRRLHRNSISIHPFVVTELVLGNLPHRQKASASLDRLPMVKVGQASEVRTMIEAPSLFRRGIGFVDAHLLTSTLIGSQTVRWTRDKQLRKIAERLGPDAIFHRRR
jgi:predicted nucleic acid-binding protein